VARLSATHKRAQTVSGPPQSPTRSLEVSGFQTNLLNPWYKVRAEIIPFQYSPVLLGRKGVETRVTCHPRERERERRGEGEVLLTIKN